MEDEATDVRVLNDEEGPYRAPWPTWDAGIRWMSAFLTISFRSKRVEGGHVGEIV
jgi:hypothetical protein